MEVKNTAPKRFKLWALVGIAIAYLIFLIGNYYTGSMWMLIEFGIACVISVVIFAISTVKIYRKKETLSRGIVKTAVIVLILAVIFTYSWQSTIVEKLDWMINSNSRLNIAQQVISGSIKEDMYGNYKLPVAFPILSNGGNEINVTRYPDNTINVRFLITKALLFGEQDYWVYTNNISLMKDFEVLIKENPKLNRKLRDNWYRVQSYPKLLQTP